MTHVAFLGLGAIGRPMAACLARAEGVTLTVWNRTVERAASFSTEHGARHAASPAEAVQGADVVFTCLPVSADVESLLEGSSGMLAALERGTVLVDCTSGDATTSRRIAARLATVGVEFLDAPVSGGVKGAESGTLTVMVGGDAAVLERVRPTIAAFGQTVVHCGPTGSGDAVKAVNQALLAIHIWSAGEGLVALSKAGVKPEVALEIINASSGRSNASINLFPERVIGRKFPRTFKLALLDKDIDIAAGLMRELKVPSPLTQLAAELTRVAHNALGEEADHVEAVKVIEQWAGQEIA